MTSSDAVTNPDVELCLQPLGEHDEAMLAASARGARHIYGFRVKVLEARPLPKSAWHEPRKRYRAEILLDHLRDDVRPGTTCTFIVGFTSKDISTTRGKYPDWGILGLGELGGVVAVVSSYRTHKRLKAPHTALRRVVKVVNHEIGHVMGLPHREAPGCMMNDAEGTVSTVDTEHGRLCKPTIDYIEKHRGYSIPVRTRVDWSYIEGDD